MNMMKFLTVVLSLILASSVMAEQILSPYEYLDTTGARELTPFTINNEYFIAVAQLARDIPGTPPNMNGGDADVDVLIYKINHGKHVIHQRIPGHGNESTAFFTIGNDAYLAVASVHSGPKAPFNHHTYSMLYKWDGQFFYPVQQFYSYAAKQWHFFSIGTRHFLALAEGVKLPDGEQKPEESNSIIYEWNGERFQPFQKISSQWGYSFQFFRLNGENYLAYADHLKQSTLYRWDGAQFKEYQVFPGDGGRSFEAFTIGNKHYLAYANIKSDSIIYQWNGKQFETYQALQGAGGRNFTYFTLDGKHYLLRVNFITGDRTNPKSALQSPLYKWMNNQFEPIQNIPSFGGVSAHVYRYDDSFYMTFANSLSADLRFKVRSVIYKISQAPVLEYG
ncbi:hypothetical protein [uncultured Legionella sp.]|uniref:hypothetical protein n=1 Tax=uncultured Legionella sp. TaxID=210934 RepID=UPI0026239B2D|nr:hypothetical protein [uncultured Legionella sp.]